MLSTRQSKRLALRQYLQRKQPAEITEAEWDELTAALAPVSESYLRRMLRESDLPLSPLVEGVRQQSLADLERTLAALLAVYERAGAEQMRTRARACRKAVIAAKDHAKWVASNPRTSPEKRAEKEEMILWMLTWLENPPVFPAWLALRKRAISGRG